MSITNFQEPVLSSCHACEKDGNDNDPLWLSKENLQLMVLSVNIDANLNIITMATN